MISSGIKEQNLIKMEITKEQILKIVDQCFHSYASSFRNEARQEATDLIEKHELAINYSRSSVPLRQKSKSYFDVRSLADIKRLYPEGKEFTASMKGGFVTYYVDKKQVLTKALMV